MHQRSDRFRLDPTVVRFSVPENEIAEEHSGYKHQRIIGQPRAVEALKLAIAIRAKGYNVFVAGPTGTGKRTAVMRILREQPFRPETLRDVVFVNNFKQPDRPRTLYFSAGDASRFRRRVQGLVDTLREQLPGLLETSGFREERDRIMLDTESREAEALQSFESRLTEEGFTIVQVQEEQEQRSDINPVIDGEPVPLEDLQQHVSRGTLPQKSWNRIRRRYYQLMDQMNQIFLSLRGERMVAENQLRTLQRETVLPLLDKLVGEIDRDFNGDKIHVHLEDLKEDLLDNLELFVPQELSREQEIQQELQRYGVNILMDHGSTRQTPVVFESHPDYQKLFGTQDPGNDPEGRNGFLGLRGGSLVAASGGYIVLRAEDVLSHEEIWSGIKRVLQDGVTEIRTPPTPFGSPMASLKPEPIDLDLKIILMGSEHVYDLLFYQDEEFGKLFKVLSEFDSVMENTRETRRAYLDFIQMICEEEHLLPIETGGKAAVLEYGVRLSEFRDKLSTRFSLVADLLRESSHWSQVAGNSVIDRTAVEKAREMRRFLHNMPEEKYDEQLSSGEMILQVDGERIGAINGLSVLDRGYYAFGRPMLITARVAPGSDGIINIERESGLSGELHDKGIYIIQGFLQATYATDFPLSINASIGFEQSYVEVDGDSASSTEIYVLLSAIGGLPLRQDIAVTGSVNQFGQIQPVGGISEKIEGFHATCALMGLTGKQGVLIPRTNIQNLILSRGVQDAVENGLYHIYAIDTVDEGIEILTGIVAGERGGDGHFPKNTVNGMVERRLRQMATQVKDFS
ncbi:MAG: ATP-binding protein [Spirochaetaceae bacterium]|nr:MAG: ATP-binding protein [Spirochaetaceae bacterium]